ncbi:hypothetical protein DKG77_15305 [Flagellimonas aquimarina]|uniref:Cardiolipin synthetase n=1 Tax=Flagellimonas aquimarina TaxID=2201895 RepID=A0A316KV88_9FLAO|nr:hypothetical protein [Allomuricauda koreensis]PWL37664.1 hypothetical protein DKG77_15305 [Allomuricauda koreensis]
MKKLIILMALALIGCSSASLVTNWKNPEIVLFDANKVLIVGMTSNTEARAQFEEKLQDEFSKRNIEAFKSIDLFDVEFTSSEKSEEELSEVEQQLLNKDFDAILFTKIIGSENKETFRKRMSKMDWSLNSFNEDYLEHQPIFYEEDYYEEFTIYHAETSLYCICVGKERELIWRGNIDITDPVNIDKTIDDYIKLVVFALKEQDLIFRKEYRDEITSL